MCEEGGGLWCDGHDEEEADWSYCHMHPPGVVLIGLVGAYYRITEKSPTSVNVVNTVVCNYHMFICYRFQYWHAIY